MNDRRTHRGAAPRDRALFSPAATSRLRDAVDHSSWLADHGYAEGAALTLVGDRFALTVRQRQAVRRATCSTAALRSRLARRIELPEGVLGADSPVAVIHIDGFNVLTTIEAALSGAVVLHCRDGCYRDLQGVHGSYRKVEETIPALRILRAELELLGCSECHWYLDRPVSNSGRLKALIAETMAGDGTTAATSTAIRCEVHLVPDPDPILARVDAPIATADSVILDACTSWLNLARRAIERSVPEAWIVRLVEADG